MYFNTTSSWSRSDDSTPSKKLLFRLEHQQHHKKQTRTEKIDNKEIFRVSFLGSQNHKTRNNPEFSLCPTHVATTKFCSNVHNPVKILHMSDSHLLQLCSKKPYDVANPGPPIEAFGVKAVDKNSRNNNQT